MNVKMSREKLLNLYKTLGMQAIVNLLNKMYPSLKLYNASTGWLNDAKYILKCKGEGGDLIVDWEESA